METFCVTFPDPNDTKKMDDFQKMMDAVNDAHIAAIRQLAVELSVSEGAAANISYLRSRSRWTQEKEDYLIWLAQNEQPAPNIMDDFDVPEGYRYSLMNTLEACIAFLKQVPSATRPQMAAATGKKIRSVNKVVCENSGLGFRAFTGKEIFLFVSGKEGKGSHTDPAVYTLSYDWK